MKLIIKILIMGNMKFLANYINGIYTSTGRISAESLGMKEVFSYAYVIQNK